VNRQLIAPTAHLQERWLEAHAEWGEGLHEDGFGLTASDEVESAEGFAAWIARLRAGSDHGTLRWILEDGQVQGGIALRHELNEISGHIGYGIRPSARGRGLATWALGEMLGLARDRGMDRVMLVCLAGNVGSARTIERNGGVLSEVRRTGEHTVHCYWIGL
jgi:predicted acetyltransferase